MSSYCSLTNGFCINCRQGLCSYAHHCKLKLNCAPINSSNSSDNKNVSCIAFNADLIRAIICGLKTETRRLATSASPKYKKGHVYFIGEPWQEVFDDKGNRKVYYKSDGIIPNKADMIWKDAKTLKKSDSRYKIYIIDYYLQKLKDVTLTDILNEGFNYPDYHPDNVIFSNFRCYLQECYPNIEINNDTYFYVYKFKLV